jgi:hypothetical protein
MISSDKTARLVSLGRDLDTEDDAPWLLAPSTESLKLEGSLLVGPFETEEIEAAWKRLSSEWKFSGAVFAVLRRRYLRTRSGVRKIATRVDDASRKILDEKPYYALGQMVHFESFYLLELDDQGRVALDEKGHLTRARDFRHLEKLVGRSTAPTVVGVEAVLGERWHCHM